MCGIAGIYSRSKIADGKNKIGEMVTKLAHRGPDGSGVWINDRENLILGHTRLSILDLSDDARQPMISGDGKFALVFNGEIYNFIELREKLSARGHKFTTESDTEVLLNAYREWGLDMFDSLNGMWAMAIYDINRKELVLSRDRFGIKPLFYKKTGSGIVFASEVSAIADQAKDKQNPAVLSAIASCSLDYHFTESTFYEDICALQAGSLLIIDEVGNTAIKKWYKLAIREVPESFEAQSSELLGLLSDASKIRLRSDVPVATCLSGGIDSSTISAVINSIAPENSRFQKFTHRSFCASFPNSEFDESQKAKNLADGLGIELDIVQMKCPTSEDLAKSMLDCDGPMHSLAFYPIWKLYGHIKASGIKVTLDGQGPDEMLGGYRPLKEALISAILEGDMAWGRDAFDIYSSQGENRQFSSKQYARRILFRMPLHLLKYFIKTHLDDSGFWFRSEYGSRSYFEHYFYKSFFLTPLPGILSQFDRCSMAHGVECRMPFMDYRLVEFIFSLPRSSKVGYGYTKRILREAVKGLVPDEIRLDKQKIGFNAPIVEWFRGGLKEFMLDTMSSENFIQSGYFNGRKVQDNFIKFLRSSHPSWDDAWKFWGPVHVVWWLDNRSKKL